MPALAAARESKRCSARLSRTIRMRSGESFGPWFAFSADSFCFPSWRPPPRPRLRRFALRRVASVFGPLDSLMTTVALSGSSAFVGPPVGGASTGGDNDVGWQGGEQSPAGVSTKLTPSSSSPSFRKPGDDDKSVGCCPASGSVAPSTEGLRRAASCRTSSMYRHLPGFSLNQRNRSLADLPR